MTLDDRFCTGHVFLVEHVRTRVKPGLLHDAAGLFGPPGRVAEGAAHGAICHHLLQRTDTVREIDQKSGVPQRVQVGAVPESL